jgi:hypothetical protein
MKMRYAAAVLVVVSALSNAAVLALPAAPSPYRDAKRTGDVRVADLLGRMTPAEKVAQLEAVNWENTTVYERRTYERRIYAPLRARVSIGWHIRELQTECLPAVHVYVAS